MIDVTNVTHVHHDFTNRYEEQVLKRYTLCPNVHVISLAYFWTRNYTILGNHSDYTAVTRLLSNTTELVCAVRRKLNEHDLRLECVWWLKRLVLIPEKPTTYLKAKLSGSVSAIHRSDLLQNLTSLTSLGLNIPTRFLTLRLLDPVPKSGTSGFIPLLSPTRRGTTFVSEKLDPNWQQAWDTEPYHSPTTTHVKHYYAYCITGRRLQPSPELSSQNSRSVG